MKKYILAIRFTGTLWGSLKLRDSKGAKVITKISIKDTRKIKKDLRWIGEYDKGVVLRYDDGHLRLAINGVLNKKFFSSSKYREYRVTNLQDSSVFLKMRYLGFSKWQIETDFEDFKKLVSICYGIVDSTLTDSDIVV